jgi:hypothetical protein
LEDPRLVGSPPTRGNIVCRYSRRSASGYCTLHYYMLPRTAISFNRCHFAMEDEEEACYSVGNSYMSASLDKAVEYVVDNCKSANYRKNSNTLVIRAYEDTLVVDADMPADFGLNDILFDSKEMSVEEVSNMIRGLVAVHKVHTS